MFLKMNKHMKESKLQPIPRASAETLLQLEPELKPKQTFRLPHNADTGYISMANGCVYPHAQGNVSRRL
jgi:hypothetical protein